MKTLIFLFVGLSVFFNIFSLQAMDEDEIREKIANTIAHSYQNQSLIPVHQEEGIIKTKSQKPTALRLQNVIQVSISAQPIEEFYGNEEVVTKKNKDGEDASRLAKIFRFDLRRLRQISHREPMYKRS